MMSDQAPRRYLISIATYRRPERLARLLNSLAKSVDDSAAIVVTDNDSAESARAIAAESTLPVTYLVEPAPGIASARNKGLERFTSQYEAIIFLDDDEWVEPEWYSAMTGFLEKNEEIAVAQGPVLTVLPADAPSWIERGGFYQRRIRSTGDHLPSAATNNTALRYSAWVAAGAPRFDGAFSATGGSDWDLFWSIRKAGGVIAYCGEAVASEDVPASRLTPSWIRQRYLRNGIVESRVMRKHSEPLMRFIALAFAAAGVGCIQLLFDVLRGRGVRARALSRVLISAGKISGLVGYKIEEYKRTP